MFLNFFIVILLSLSFTALSSGDEQKVLDHLNSRLGSSPSFAKLSTGDKLNAVLSTLEAEPALAGEELEDLNSPAGNKDSLDVLKSNMILAFQCYDDTVGKGVAVNVFHVNRSEVIRRYFEQHPNVLEDDSIATLFKRIKGLITNIAYIARRVIECIREAKAGGSDYKPTKIGLTSRSAYSHEEFKSKFSVDYSKLLTPVNKLSTGNLAQRRKDKDPNFDDFVIEDCAIPKLTFPEEFDWREHLIGGNYSVVVLPKSQGGCNSCFVFAATAAMESAFMLSKANAGRPNQTRFSEQALLDCYPDSDACKKGGNAFQVPFTAYQYGLTDEWRLPYKEKKEACPAANGSLPVVARTTGLCKRLPVGTDQELMAMVGVNGPAFTGIWATDADFQNLRGPYNHDCSVNNDTNHAVLAIGWTPEYFIYKNSWGPDWGIQGYLYLHREPERKDTRRCGIKHFIGFPYFPK